MAVTDKILAARTSLIWDQPFFGTLAMQLEQVDATDDPAINTMATDGKRLYFHAPFVDKLSKQELMFVLAHEVMHNALEHHIRRQSRDPKLWNIACDFAINGELVETKVGKMPECGLIDAKFTGMGAEEIYRILQQDMEKNGKASAGGVTFVPGQGNDPGGCGEILDGCPQHDEAAIAEARVENQTRIRQAAMLAKAANAGSVPAGLKRIIEELLIPKVDWRAVLRRFVDESVTRDFTWTKPNRRLLPHGLITPGMIGDGVPHLVIAVDTSGSIDNKILSDFAAEVRGAFEDGAVDRLTVIYADARVAHIEEFEQGDELRLHAAGGGGTAFSDTFKRIRKDYPDARATIYLTDMHVYDFGDDPGMPVLWGVYGRTQDWSSLSYPFGEAINISV